MGSADFLHLLMLGGHDVCNTVIALDQNMGIDPQSGLDIGMVKGWA